MRTTLQVALYLLVIAMGGAVMGIVEVLAERLEPGVVLWIVGVGAVVAITVQAVRRRRVQPDVDAILDELGVRAVPPPMQAPMPEGAATSIVADPGRVRRQVPRRYVRSHDA
jgi:hypothetical protein